MHGGDGYLSSPERSPRPYGGSYLTPTTSYEDPYYGITGSSGGSGTSNPTSAGGQFPSRSGSVTPVIDDEAR